MSELRNVRPQDKSVLYALTLRAHKDKGYTCFPSLPTICEDAGYSKTSTKAVRKSLRNLEEQGLISIERRWKQRKDGDDGADHSKDSHLFTVHVGVEAKPLPDDGKEGKAVAIPTTRGGGDVTRRGDVTPMGKPQGDVTPRVGDTSPPGSGTRNPINKEPNKEPNKDSVLKTEEVPREEEKTSSPGSDMGSSASVVEETESTIPGHDSGSLDPSWINGGVEPAQTDWDRVESYRPATAEEQRAGEQIRARAAASWDDVEERKAS